MTLTADEARRLTKENLQGPVIEHWVKALNSEIERKARKGKSSFEPWIYLGSLRTPTPNPGEQKALKKHFENLGYEFTDHPDPDPGHPASRPYTTLSW